MFTLLIVLFFRAKSEDSTDKIFNTVFFAIVSPFVISFLLFIGIGFFAETEYFEARSIPIYSFVNRQEIEGSFGGSFIMQSGSIENGMFYHYIAGSHMGGKTIYKVSVNRASIIESKEKPKLIIIEERFTNPFINEHFGFFAPSYKFFKFHIPENTIDTTFEIKL